MRYLLLLAILGLGACAGPPPLGGPLTPYQVARFRCSPDGKPGGRSPFEPGGGDYDACVDALFGDWR